MNHAQDIQNSLQQDVVKKIPQINTISLFIVFPFLLVCSLSSLFVNIYSGDGPNKVFSLFEAVGIIAVSIFAIMKLFTSRKMERKRQVAARGDDIRLLAEEQPNEDISVVSPPFTIELRTDWRGYSVFIGMVLVLLALSVDAATIFVYVTSFIGIGIGSLMSAGFIGLLLYMVMLAPDLHADQEITATAYGLIKKNGVRMERIAWHDVRLFAIDGVFGLGKYPYPVLFELASKDQMFTFYWTHTYSGGLFLPITRPAGSYEEYDRQMRMLLTIIARQTGLPLYDVRKNVPV